MIEPGGDNPMNRWFGLTALAVVAMAAAMPANAQDKKEIQGYVAAGYSEPLGDAGKFVNGGWNISGGAVLRPNPSKPFAIRFDLGYTRFEASSSTIRSIQGQPGSAIVNGGYMSLGNLTVDGLYEFGGHGKVGGFVGVGIGGMRRYAALTSTYGGGGYYCDPWTGFCYNTGGAAIVDDTSLTKMQYEAVAGITFAVGSGDLYLEARYRWMLSADPTTEDVPILIGYRF
jgi:hypothetical protein